MTLKLFTLDKIVAKIAALKQATAYLEETLKPQIASTKRQRFRKMTRANTHPKTMIPATGPVFGQ